MDPRCSRETATMAGSCESYVPARRYNDSALFFGGAAAEQWTPITHALRGCHIAAAGVDLVELHALEAVHLAFRQALSSRSSYATVFDVPHHKLRRRWVEDMGTELSGRYVRLAMACEESNPETATDCYHRALFAATRADDMQRIGEILLCLGSLSRKKGKLPSAVRYLTRAIDGIHCGRRIDEALGLRSRVSARLELQCVQNLLREPRRALEAGRGVSALLKDRTGGGAGSSVPVGRFRPLSAPPALLPSQVRLHHHTQPPPRLFADPAGTWRGGAEGLSATQLAELRGRYCLETADSFSQIGCADSALRHVERGIMMIQSLDHSLAGRDGDAACSLVTSAPMRAVLQQLRRKQDEITAGLAADAAWRDFYATLPQPIPQPSEGQMSPNQKARGHLFSAQAAAALSHRTIECHRRKKARPAHLPRTSADTQPHLPIRLHPNEFAPLYPLASPFVSRRGTVLQAELKERQARKSGNAYRIKPTRQIESDCSFLMGTAISAMREREVAAAREVRVGWGARCACKDGCATIE